MLEIRRSAQGIKTYSNWPTIPQLYVKGEFVGGCDIIREMFQAGELQSLMKEKGVPVKDRRAGVAHGSAIGYANGRPSPRPFHLSKRSPCAISANNIRRSDAAPSAPGRAPRLMAGTRVIFAVILVSSTSM